MCINNAKRRRRPEDDQSKQQHERGKLWDTGKRGEPTGVASRHVFTDDAVRSTWQLSYNLKKSVQSENIKYSSDLKINKIIVSNQI